MSKNIKLSPRLQTALSFAEGAVLADIGTDHAHLPIAAIQTGKAERAIACDIKAGPLKKAEENIRLAGLSEKIETRLGAGLAPLEIGEADCAVIAGMGGMMIAQILSEEMETAKSIKKIVLQPQHDAAALRKFLHESFFEIIDEELIADGGKYYFLMTAVSGKESRDNWSEAEYFYGRYILQKRSEVLEEFLKKEAGKIETYMKSGANASLLYRKELNDEARKFLQ